MKTRELGTVTIRSRTSPQIFTGHFWRKAAVLVRIDLGLPLRLAGGSAVHAASSARAFRRITCGGCPKARRKARRMR
jgi:hypothetical protein